MVLQTQMFGSLQLLQLSRRRNQWPHPSWNLKIESNADESQNALEKNGRELVTLVLQISEVASKIPKIAADQHAEPYGEYLCGRYSRSLSSSPGRCFPFGGCGRRSPPYSASNSHRCPVVVQVLFCRCSFPSESVPPQPHRNNTSERIAHGEVLTAR